MPRGAIYTVEDVLQQALVLAGIGGKMCPFYFVKWAGYPLARATWEPRESFSAGNPVMAANILPLEAQLERYGKKELAAHHRQTLKLAQHELRRVIQRWEQARGDFLISCLLRVELLTAYRLWFQRLSRLAPGMRKAGDGELWTGCTTWSFDSISEYCYFVWPRTLLRRLSATVQHHGREHRRMLCVSARVTAPRHVAFNETVLVLSATKVYSRARRRVFHLVHSKLRILCPIGIRFNAGTEYRNNLRIRGLGAEFTDAEWDRVKAHLPEW